MTVKADAIRSIYAQVAAPEWAAPNLDALADVLRDLSWLPPGEVEVTVPDLRRLAARDRHALRTALARAVAASADGTHPLRLHGV